MNDSVETFFQQFKETNISIKLSKNILTNRKISIDHIFIEYQQNIIHLAVLHKYHSYYLIYENTLRLSANIHLSFGDTIRAIEP